jgi:Mor family transcriptional regulator
MVPLSKVEAVIGSEAYQKLLERFPGGHIYIKKVIDDIFPDKQSRNKAILNDYYAGASRAELAAKYCLSVPSIDKITGKR